MSPGTFWIWRLFPGRLHHCAGSWAHAFDPSDQCPARLPALQGKLVTSLFLNRSTGPAAFELAAGGFRPNVRSFSPVLSSLPRREPMLVRPHLRGEWELLCRWFGAATAAPGVPEKPGAANLIAAGAGGGAQWGRMACTATPSQGLLDLFTLGASVRACRPPRR